jgi:hypothetical protein
VARLFTSGFEGNSNLSGNEISSWSGAATVVTTPVRTGTYAAKFAAAGTSPFCREHCFAADQSTAVYTRVYIRIAAAPTALCGVIRVANAANTRAADIRLNTDRTLRLDKADATQLGSASAALAVDTWYMIELKVDASSNPGSLDARLNGVSFASGANSSQVPWSRVLVGPFAGNPTLDMYADDWAINDSTGSNQTSWPGNGAVIQLMPNADGDAHAWLKTAGGAGDSNNYQLVDEIPNNDASDFVQSVTLNAEDLYNVGASGLAANQPITCVGVSGRFRNDTADATTAFKFELEKAASGTKATSANIVPNSTTWRTGEVTGTQTSYPLMTYTDPDGAAWTQATLDTMQIGVKLAVAGTNKINLSTIWAVVDYVPLTAVTKTAAVTWNVRQTVTNTSVETWNVRSSVAKTASVAWSVHTSATKASAVEWAVRQAVVATSAVGWNVRAAIARTAAVTWSVRQEVAQSVAVTWAVWQTVASTSAVSWAIRGAVGRAVAVSWSVRSSVTKTAVVSWAVWAPVVKSAEVSWDVRSAATKTAQVSWDVESPTAVVVATYSVSWSVRQSVMKFVSVTWRVRKPMPSHRPAGSTVRVGPAGSATASRAVGVVTKGGPVSEVAQ